MIMAGAYPGALDDRQNDQFLKRQLSKGIDTFVCLQAEVDIEITEEAWRAGNGLRPYILDAERLSRKPLKWVHVPIPDGDAAPDDVTEQLVLDLVADVYAGRVLYVHCWGGHGRTGVVVCLMLVHLYGITAAEALRRVQRYHDCRVEPQDAKSPQSAVQRSQVKRLAQKLLTNPRPFTGEVRKGERLPGRRDSRVQQAADASGRRPSRGRLAGSGAAAVQRMRRSAAKSGLAAEDALFE